MAIVVLGGLVTSTLLSLFVLPALYLPLRAAGSRLAPEDECSTGGPARGPNRQLRRPPKAIRRIGRRRLRTRHACEARR